MRVSSATLLLCFVTIFGISECQVNYIPAHILIPILNGSYYPPNSYPGHYNNSQQVFNNNRPPYNYSYNNNQPSYNNSYNGYPNSFPGHYNNSQQLFNNNRPPYNYSYNDNQPSYNKSYNGYPISFPGHYNNSQQLFNNNRPPYNYSYNDNQPSYNNSYNGYQKPNNGYNNSNYPIFNNSYLYPRDNGSSDGHLFLGDIQAPDRLLFSQVYTKSSRWWSSREKTITYPQDLPSGYARHETISAIRLTNTCYDGDSTKTKIEKGGIGRTYVSLKVTSGRGYPLCFMLQIFGH